MFSGIMSSVAMCREQNKNMRPMSDELNPPTRFIRGIGMSTRSSATPFGKRFLHPSETATSAGDPHSWKREYAEAFFYGGETVSQSQRLTTHRDHTLLSRNGQDGVVTPWSPGSGVDEEVNGLVCNWCRRQLGEHDVQVDCAKDLLKGVESQPTQFTLDEVGAVLHDSFELEMPVPTLPARDEMEHVGALGALPSFPAGVAGESDGKRGEEGEVCGLVSHAKKPREEVDFTGDGRDSQEAGGSHNEEREYCFVCEPFSQN
jgi:hypothetical protein